MSAMLAGRIDGRSLVLAHPLLLEKQNPGSWPNVFSDFRIHADFESLGKLDKVISRGTEKYKNVFIDEAHRFRRETNALPNQTTKTTLKALKKELKTSMLKPLQIHSKFV